MTLIALVAIPSAAFAVAPIAGDDMGTTRSGPTAGEQVNIDASLNDSDADGDPLSFNVGTEPANGSVLVSPTGLLRYTPNAGFTGIDVFTYTVSDGINPDVTGNVSVTVIADIPPVAVDDSATTPSTPIPALSAIEIPVLANDTDPDGDVLAYADIEIVQQPANGSVSQSCLGACSPPEYQPNAGYSGTDTFTYRAVDPLGAQSNIATVTIVVTADVAAPTAVDDVAATTVDTPVAIDVLANDSVDGLPVTILPAGGQTQLGGVYAVNNDNLIDYTPPSGFTGQDSFSYTLEDDLGQQSAPAMVTITVSAVNQAPVAVISGGNRTIADTDGTPGELVSFDSTSSSDPEGDALSCFWSVNGVAQDAGCGANIQFQLPDGSNDVSLQVVDSNEIQSPTVAVAIAVLSNSAPVAVIAGGDRAVADSNSAPGESVAIDGSSSSDSNGTVVTYEWSVGGQPVPAAAGPRPSLALQDGANAVGLTVVDNSGARSAPTSVTITVRSVVSAPVVTITVGSTSIPDSDGQPGENVPFEGSATDADGPVAVNTFRWSVNGQAIASANGQASPVLALLNGSNTIALSATDNGGNAGSESIVVTVGETSALTDLPGIEGNENLENTAGATESTCSALLKADPASLSPDQANLRATCETVFANVDENPAQVADALQQIGGQQVTAQQSTAIDYTAAQMLNVAGRLTALRQGARGFSTTGLSIGDPVSGVPINALASLGKSLFGEGGSSGDDEGGLLDDRLGIFLNGSVRFGDKDATSRESGFDFDTFGVTAGADYRFTDALVAGLAFGYGTASADFDANGGTQDSDSYSGSIYGSWYGRNSYFDGIVSLGSVSYDSIRNIDLFDGAIVDKAIGQTDGMQLAFGVASGYDFGQGGFRFGPNFAVNYIKVDIDGFRERTTATSGLAMAFGDQTADSLTVKAGGHFNYSLSRKWGVLSPQARFDIVREFANEAQRVSVRYANDPTLTAPGQAGGTFVIFTDNPDEYYFLWAIGVSAQFVNGFSGFVDYEQTESLDTIRSSEFSFGLRYQTRFR